MTTLRIGDRVDYKPSAGLGGWRSGGVLTGYIGKLWEVTAGKQVHALKSTHIRITREESLPDRGAQQAAARATRLLTTSMEAAPGDPPLPIPRDIKPIRLQRAASAVEAISPRPKATKPARSLAYLKHVRLQPCAVTGGMAEDAHHYTSALISRGTATKVSDLYCVPLTHQAHMEWHARGEVEQAKLEAHSRGMTYGGLATRVAFLEAALKSLVQWTEARKEGDDD